MAKTLDLDDFDNPPPPPRYLYKYLSAERVGNVLEGGTVRFTPLMNTNDSFEVRATFDKVAGPKFLSMLKDQIDSLWSRDFAKSLIKELLEARGVSFVSADALLDALDAKYDGDFLTGFRAEMGTYSDQVVAPAFNTPERVWQFVENIGKQLLCFSLSERMDSAPMWAHYADNNSGFVVAFDTRSEWFTCREDGTKGRLQRVAYFDGKVEEPLQNVQAALVSKTADWAYEREWRLYAKEAQIDKIVGSPSDLIHLINFPSDIVDRVILGPRTSDEVASRIREVVAAKYPKARLVRAIPNRANHTYDEVDT